MADKAADAGYGFFDNAPGAPEAPSTQVVGGGTCAQAQQRPHRPSRQRPSLIARPVAWRPRPSACRSRRSDQLINLVGELVITQAMLAQTGRGLDPVVYQQPVAGLTDLDRNTRDLQEAVM